MGIIDKIKLRIETELLDDQEKLHNELTKEESDPLRVSYYEGCCSTFRTVLLIMENEK